METKTKRNTVEGELWICCHRVKWWYDLGDRKLNEILRSCMEEEAEERAQKMIVEGCHSGELNCVINFDNDTSAEFRGWWRIED